MRPLTPYQTQIARAVLGSVLKEEGRFFTVEMARGAGAREVSAQLELLLLTLGVHTGARMVKVVPPGDCGHALRLVERLESRAQAHVYLREAGVVRSGRAEQRFVAPDDIESLPPRISLIEVADAERWTTAFYEEHVLPLARASGATVVLYGRPWNGGTWFERTKQANEEAERAGRAPLHFRVARQAAAAHLPGYGAAAVREAARLGDDDYRVASGLELRPMAALSPLLTAAQESALEGEFRRRRAPGAGICYAASVNVTWLPQPRTSPALLAEEDAEAVVTIAVHCPGEGQSRVVEHLFLHAADGPGLAWELAKALRGEWRCSRVAAALPANGGEPARAMRLLLTQAIGADALRWARVPSGAELLALADAAEEGRVAVYVDDGSPERRALAHELREARVERRGDGTLGVRQAAGNAGLLEGLALLAADIRGGQRGVTERTLARAS